jgi:hypothetical protein
MNMGPNGFWGFFPGWIIPSGIFRYFFVNLFSIIFEDDLYSNIFDIRNLIILPNLNLHKLLVFSNSKIIVNRILFNLNNSKSILTFLKNIPLVHFIEYFEKRISSVLIRYFIFSNFHFP